MAKRLLEEAMRTAAMIGDLPAYVMDGLKAHADVVNSFGSGKQYEVSLLY